MRAGILGLVGVLTAIVLSACAGEDGGARGPGGADGVAQDATGPAPGDAHGDAVRSADSGAGDAPGGGAADGAADAADAGPALPMVSLPAATLRDRLEGGWVGQMVGVVQAGLTEFGYRGRIIPEAGIPPWMPTLFFTAYMQDDLYVEIPFLEALAAHGITSGWDPVAAAFAATEFPLWHGNEAARNALRAGAAAPDAGHFRHNEHCDDIDWQIETDFLGLLAPGMPAVAADLAWRHGHVIGFGDGVYGGVFVAAMHAEAYVTTDLRQVIAAGLAAIPPESDFRAVLEDVIAWHAAHPDDWIATWQLVEDRWGQTDRCPTGRDDPYNIDAKLNAAYVLIGLLYGEGDFERSVLTAIRCGQDSDCNGSTVGGILGTMYGLSGIPDRFLTELDPQGVFDFTERTLTESIDLTEALAREALHHAGGRIEGSGADETWILPRAPVPPLVLEQWPADDDEPPALTARVVAQDGRTVSFEASATDDDGIHGYGWSFGDLSGAAGATPTHTWRSAGTWEVLVWAADTGGNTSWTALTVEIP